MGIITNEEIDVLVATHIMGDDLTANTPVRRVKAMRRVAFANIGFFTLRLKNKYEIVVPHEVKFELEKLKGEDARYYWIFANRIGKPWCQEIEDYMAAWRETPPGYSTYENFIWDINRKMVQAGYGISIIYTGTYEVEFSSFKKLGYGKVFRGSQINLSRTVCLAALAAVGVELDEEK